SRDWSSDVCSSDLRSNWLQRPLSENQLNYAAMDVIYLHKLYEKLSNELKGTEKEAWVNACNLELSEQFYKNQNPSQYFSKFKNSWRMTFQQQYILFNLSLWRENTAREKNKPRGHIVGDDALFELALKQPASQDELKKMVQLSPANRKYYGDTLVSLLNTLKKTLPEPSSTPWPAPNEPLPREAGEILNRLKFLAENTAEKLNMAPEMLVRKKDLQ